VTEQLLDTFGVMEQFHRNSSIAAEYFSRDGVVLRFIFPAAYIYFAAEYLREYLFILRVGIIKHDQYMMYVVMYYYSMRYTTDTSRNTTESWMIHDQNIAFLSFETRKQKSFSLPSLGSRVNSTHAV